MPAKSFPPSIEPRFRINYGRQLAFGPGKADLLEQIDRTGSISEAAKAMGMSYMRAWTLAKSMDSGCAEPFIRKIRGGNSRGGAQLTETGREVLRHYRELEKITVAVTAEIQVRLTTLLTRQALTDQGRVVERG